MNLGRISVKGVFLLAMGGMAVSMLAICAVLLWMTGERWVLTTGGLLTLCALVWMFLLTIAFSKRLSVFTRELCREMDQMISGSREPVRASDSEALFARISYRLTRLYAGVGCVPSGKNAGKQPENGGRHAALKAGHRRRTAGVP